MEVWTQKFPKNYQKSHEFYHLKYKFKKFFRDFTREVKIKIVWEFWSKLTQKIIVEFTRAQWAK